MERRETLYLIDGYAAIFRAYYAIRRPLYSPTTGEETQAVYVFAQMLLKLYTVLKPDYVAVAMDAPGGTFRDDLYAGYFPPPTETPAPTEGEPPVEVIPVPGYKGTRAATPDSLHDQVPRILELVSLLGIPIVSKTGLEADDVIATLTDRALGSPDHPALHVRIVSPDKDLEQMLGDRVTLYDVHTEAELDVEALRTKRGVEPGQIVDLLALTGDQVDNIPGIEGIGPKTAAKLLQQFGSLEGILERLDEVPVRWRDRLEQARPRLPLSRRLLTLERDADIPFSLDDARVRPLPADSLHRFFGEMGFNRLRERFAPATPTSPPA